MNRDRRLIAVFATLALLAGGVAVVGIVTTPGPPEPVVSREVTAGADGLVRVEFVGDTVVGGPLQPIVDRFGHDRLFGGLRTDDADFVVATGDAPITDRVPVDPTAPSLTSRPPAAAAMARAGLGALVLATDHVLDSGAEGLADTMAHADAAGLATVGAGPDLARAEQPLLLRTPHGTIGVVAIGESFGHRARELTPGTAVLDPETVTRGADLARRAGADWVIAAVHWGQSYGPVEAPQRYWAEVFATAGYDLVIGSGPHVTQPIEMIGTMPVVYSVGNLVHGGDGRYGPDTPGYGLAVGVQVGPDRRPGITIRCLVAGDRTTDVAPRYCDDRQTAAQLPPLSPDLQVQGDRAVLDCACFAREEAP